MPVIFNADKMHWRDDVPFVECEKKTKQHRKQNKNYNKKQVRRNKQVRQPFFGGSQMLFIFFYIKVVFQVR